MPVVVADLHSALPAVLAGVRADAARTRRVAYVMTDGGALPAWFSRTVAGLRDAAGSARSRVGQAFGGDLEAVTVHTGPARPPGTCSAPTSRSSPRARATSAPAPGGASPGVAAGEAVNAAGGAGRPPGGRAADVRGGPAGPAPRRVAPQPDRATAGWRWPRPTWSCLRCPAPSVIGCARRLPRWAHRQAASAGRGGRRRAARRAARPRRSRCPRWAAAWTTTTADFLAAAAAGRHAAALLD